MARSDAVWGIDIGNCSLKALRCRPGEQSGKVIADAFDYIEYPKILTQPGADPAELVSDALRQFLSRNSVRGDQVAISVSGQNGLARFIKLPPVEAKKIPDIVRYEARQQIPFDLNDVIWDYQRMGGGSEEEGFILETEIGLFAMKRDQVHRALEPLDEAGIPVDYVQLTPLALYNFMVFDQLADLPTAEEYDPDNPPPSTVILSMGTDASDLVVTNGFRVWQRSIPIGGNHFTKALTKELKLTFAKAEHLKRNAATAEDPKAVFQAMRPVFNDLLTEVQRSIGYFTSIDRAAKIDRVVAVGNPIKLPGLRRYLAQGLGMDVTRLEGYQNLVGAEVLGAPAFQDNQLCFPVSYGLGIQGLKKAPLRTNLLPKEIIKDRLINAKKPWAVAAAAVLLLGCAISLASFSRTLATVDPAIFQQAQSQAKQAIDTSKRFKGEADGARLAFNSTDTIGKHLTENVEGRVRWLELLKAVSDALPYDVKGRESERIELQNKLYIDSVDCQHVETFESWMVYIKMMGGPEDLKLIGVTPASTAAVPAEGSEGTSTATSTTSEAPADAAAAGEPKGPGYIIQIIGHHYHNPDDPRQLIGPWYVRQTLTNNLLNGKVMLPPGEQYSMKELGISHPVMIRPGLPFPEQHLNPFATAQGGASGYNSPETAGSGSMPGMSSMRPMGSMGMGSRGSMSGSMGSMPGGMGGMSGSMPGGAGTGEVFVLKRFNFVVQFAWVPTPRSERVKKREAAKSAAAAQPGDAAPTDGGAPVAAPGAARGSATQPGMTPAAAPEPGTAPAAAPQPGVVPPGAPQPAVPGDGAAVAPAPQVGVPAAAPSAPAPAVPGPANPAATGTAPARFRPHRAM